MNGTISHRLAVTGISLLLVIIGGGCGEQTGTPTSAAGPQVDDSFPYRFELAKRYGTPITDREQAWPHHIAYASWVDDKHIVYATNLKDNYPTRIVCLSTEQDRIEWSIDDHDPIDDWSFSRNTRRLAICSSSTGRWEPGEGTHLAIIDCNTGKKIVNLSTNDLKPMLGAGYPIPSSIAMSDNGRLLIVAPAESEDEMMKRTSFTSRRYKAYLLDSPYKTVTASVDTIIWPREIYLSLDGNRIGYINRDDLVCVRNVTDGKVLFLKGELPTKPDDRPVVFDGDDYGHIFDGGGDTILYTLDYGWGDTHVFVHNITTQQEHDFDTGNSQIECDVRFADQRIVLTSTSTDLLLVDFSGNVLAYQKHATSQRNICVAFSPSGKQVLVGSWDGTLSVYNIVPVPGAAAAHVKADELYGTAKDRGVFFKNYDAP
ncbi:MAG: WD40 repeat domain-containing protein [Phycisphaerales bacterium]